MKTLQITLEQPSETHRLLCVVWEPSSCLRSPEFDGFSFVPIMIYLIIWKYKFYVWESQTSLLRRLSDSLNRPHSVLIVDKFAAHNILTKILILWFGFKKHTSLQPDELHECRWSSNEMTKLSLTAKLYVSECAAVWAKCINIWILIKLWTS